jgi:hypothetical protein
MKICVHTYIYIYILTYKHIGHASESSVYYTIARIYTIFLTKIHVHTCKYIWMYMIVHANELSPLKNMYEYIWMQSNILLQSACAYNMSYKTWNSQRCNKTCFRNKKHVSLFVYNMSNITWNFKYSQKTCFAPKNMLSWRKVTQVLHWFSGHEKQMRRRRGYCFAVCFHRKQRLCLGTKTHVIPMSTTCCELSLIIYIHRYKWMQSYRLLQPVYAYNMSYKTWKFSSV